MGKRRSVIFVQPSDQRLAKDSLPGTERKIICDAETPTVGLIAGVVKLIDPGCKINMHYHDIEEFQYILSGKGVARDKVGNEYALSPGSCVYCAPGTEAAHEFENTGDRPLEILFVFNSNGGKFPKIEFL